jgi:hypothetical protein
VNDALQMAFTTQSGGALMVSRSDAFSLIDAAGSILNLTS